MRRLILCADDYGLSPGVSDGIRDLIALGRLNATSVMVASPHFDGLTARALLASDSSDRPVSIGLHVTLTAPFTPLSGGPAFPALNTLLARASLRLVDRAALLREIALQLDTFEAAFGRLPDFVDGHQHVQLFPVIREAFLGTVSVKAPAAWVRQCGSARPLSRRLSDRKALLLDVLSRRFRDLARQAGLRTNPAFAGTYDFAGATPFADLFPSFLADLPDLSVVMCHPGHPDAALAVLDPVTDRRAEEFLYLSGEDFADTLDAHETVLA
jgi:predicted glycoside hydrolase/deacetylase ChbG (UPF0249 family)